MHKFDAALVDSAESYTRMQHYAQSHSTTTQYKHDKALTMTGDELSMEGLDAEKKITVDLLCPRRTVC